MPTLQVDEFTADKLLQEVEKAEKEGKSSFIFQGNEMDVGYARYLARFLQHQREKSADETDIAFTILTAASVSEWSKIPGPPEEPSAVFYQGVNKEIGGVLSVCSFDIERQGFPPGTRGYDGAYASKGTVIRMTRKIAEQVFNVAKGKVNS